MKTTRLVLAAALVALPLCVQAQPTHKQMHSINARKENQQDRIAQGVKSGQLTPGETGRLEHQESSINREEHNMRASDDGHLTRADRDKLAHQQNVESRRIFDDKHNAVTDPGVPPR